MKDLNMAGICEAKIEAKVHRILDAYDEKRAVIYNTYRLKFENLPVNERGETDADAVLELNMWNVQIENEIRKEFVAAIMKLNEEVENGTALAMERKNRRDDPAAGKAGMDSQPV